MEKSLFLNGGFLAGSVYRGDEDSSGLDLVTNVFIPLDAHGPSRAARINSSFSLQSPQLMVKKQNRTQPSASFELKPE